MRFRTGCVLLSITMLAGPVGGGSQPKNERLTANGTDSARNAAGGGGEAGDYKVNPEQSRFTAHVGVGGLLAAAGHPHTIAIRDLDGDIQWKNDSASLHFVIKAESLAEIGEEIDEKDREKVNQAVHGEALEVSKYPEIVFTGKAVSVKQLGGGRYAATIEGDLTLHGVKRQVSFPADVRLEGHGLRAMGKFTILHSDYNLKRLSAVGGAVKAKDEIELSFDLQADRGPGPPRP